MENPNKWYSRRHMGLIGILVIAMGIWAALTFFPTLPIHALLLFALIGGLGIFVSYKQKRIRVNFLGGFWIVSWGYSVLTFFRHTAYVTEPFVMDFMFKVIPVVALAALLFAYSKRLKTPGYSAFKDVAVTWMLSLIIVVPFVFSGMWDYNVKADTSLPQVMTAKVVEKYFSSDIWEWMEAETLDGDLHFSFQPPMSFYNEHHVGSMIEITVRKGALGYPWMEGYK